MVGIIDYGCGNLGSIENMIKKIGFQSVFIRDKETLASVDKIILPGVGSYDTGIQNMRKLDIIQTLNECVLEKQIPILGICLGMQLLLEGSEEGQEAGLGYIKGYVKKFQFNTLQYKIPHLGWNFLSLCKPSKIFHDFYENPRFYFVHSYHAVAINETEVLSSTEYGYKFDSTIESDNVIGVQFHPEKSHKFGMKLLKNFIELY